MTQAKRIHVRAIEGSIPAHGDGETICTAGQELLIEMHASALDVVTQPAERS